ncbi:MAG TPA: hypothetical protein PK874_07950 [Desulfobacteraceae bacterium]|nr:hypothetical protein [Desulfobacteraceae bacterium]HPJ67113.1 hypothetical protein [Desulfobacteraceae bacterium]HPQ28360.1 hypothetical protein [Desulfobacteraceae bacterium]
MEITYSFASAQGDVLLNKEMLERPFLLNPFQPHPFMLLEDYFAAIKNFILQKSGASIIRILGRLWRRDLEISDIERIIIRYEKYGTLYQIGSVEIFGGGDNIKLGTSMALTSEAKAQMALEYETIEKLNQVLNQDINYIPDMYLKGVIGVERGGINDTVVISLFEWFEDYHEWHVKKDDDGGERIVIWDLQSGYRFATDKQAYGVIKHASKILTLYYNVQTYEQIFPWHNGAGDFVAKFEENKADVRLITVRGYGPLVLSDEREFIDPLKALVLFFLSITFKMRIDKDEGMGKPVWADSITPLPVVEGLLEGLRVQESKGMCPPYSRDMVRHVLKGMELNEINTMLNSQLNSYRYIDPVDSEVIAEHLEQHANEVFQALKEI